MKYEILDKKTYKIFLNEIKWIEVTRGGGVFHLTNDNMTDKKGNWVYDNTALGIIYWDEEVQSLDNNSDEAQCFDMSNKVKWNEVILEEKNNKNGSNNRKLQRVSSDRKRVVIKNGK